MSQQFASRPLVIAPSILAADFAKLGEEVRAVDAAGADWIHLDVMDGKKAGVSLNPGTPASAIEYVIDLIDLVLVMSVNPGFGGQAFIKSALGKVSDIRAMTAGRPIDIEVDGGVAPDVAGQLAAAGANAFVAGSAVFKGGTLEAYKTNISAIRGAAALARGEAV
jgi:ribulose-phosphate 3-epimerase